MRSANRASALPASTLGQKVVPAASLCPLLTDSGLRRILGCLWEVVPAASLRLPSHRLQTEKDLRVFVGGGEGWGEATVRESGTDTCRRLCLKRKTARTCPTRRGSARCPEAAWTRGEFWAAWTRRCARLSRFAVHQKPSQHCSSAKPQHRRES